ncbi:AraC family transcriptional regulator [Clostridium felsineum]|uniref:HTH-type transcriptional activator RhaR n=1 Tax=Clostridium felsineum TaxID=36839 RepID=A0A1S8LQ95_9CLOT|nr:AraC family transcriptional regulator [Clostridium felsineum]MCR3758096.1 AraC family transcriptional regulator [Clostridium felsineum]URZ06166.1 HTH-type transcriptional activator RhaR [Clostridium felsineum]URZ11201.1 HTH-type transcriptional activator RhaR [Clostridium felsineum]URZ15867.1 HTH-type transcriptional activator RhaR [Clostridium felsineum DSM 794]
MKKSIHDKLLEITEEERKILDEKVFKVDKSIYTNENKFIIDSNMLLPKGELIDIRKHTRFIDFPEHNHNYIEVSYVYQGELRESIDGKSITLKRGEIIFLNQFITHRIEAAKEEDIIINFIIKPEFFDYVLTFLDNENVISKFLVTTLYKEYNKGEYLYFKVADQEEIQKLLEKIIIELYSPSVMSKSAIKLMVGLLLIELMRNSQYMDSYSSNNYEKKIMIDIFKYIEENYKDAVLSDICEKFKQPHYKLSRLIKRYTGMTFKELLQEKRLTKAVEFLEFSNYSILDIIDAIGYENPTYFYKIFEQKYGVTPKKYRDEM